MSSEESYRAILRYLTNEREPYAPGTEGNVKRKIRKAAACYVVRGGTLYYQRRQRHRKTFAELEVVLQPERRRGLIEAAHLGPGGTHHTRHQTWHDLSKTYWWRGRTSPVARGRAAACCSGKARWRRRACLRTSELEGPRRPSPTQPALAAERLPGGAERVGDAKGAALPTGRRPGKLGAGPGPGWGEGGFPGGRASRREGPGRAGCGRPASFGGAGGGGSCPPGRSRAATERSYVCAF